MNLFKLSILTACVSTSLTHAVENPNYISENLLKSSNTISKYLAQDELPYSVCVDEMKSTYEFLRNVNVGFFNLYYTSSESEKILKNLWSIKQSVRRHAKNWTSDNLMEDTCVSQVKGALRAVRYIEDRIGLIHHNQTEDDKIDGLTLEDHTPLFSKSFPWTMSDDQKFDVFKDLRSGDIIMWRGSSAVSASIARLGDNENNFSHLSIVYKDPETDRLYNVESLIESGLVVRSMEDVVIPKGAAKVVVYRHNNQELAQRAAEIIYEKAMERYSGKHVRTYDFIFDLEDHDNTFCSEVVYWAFKDASGGRVELPTFLTKINLKNRSFVDAIGMTTNTAFQPGDIELEPELEVIAEWRNFKQVRVNELMDNILSSMYRWMEEYNYKLRWNLFGNGAGSAAYLFRRIPIAGGKYLGGKIPLNMPRRTLKTIMSIDKASHLIYDEIFKRLYGDSKLKIYSYQEVEDIIEALRLEDLATYSRSVRFGIPNPFAKKSVFHHIFRP